MVKKIDINTNDKTEIHCTDLQTLPHSDPDIDESVNMTEYTILGLDLHFTIVEYYLQRTTPHLSIQGLQMM